MLCPFCQKGETKVVDSRGSQEYVIRRRRECLDCGRRFTTYEKIEESPLKVIKKDGARIPFDREKIRAGIEKACYKRPISPDHTGWRRPQPKSLLTLCSPRNALDT